MSRFFLTHSVYRCCEVLKVMMMLAVLMEKTGRELEGHIAKLQQQLDNVTQRSAQNDKELRLALQAEKQAHDVDVDGLTADQVMIDHT